MRTTGASDGTSSGGPSHQKGLSPFVTACFTLNYIIGTGFLTLPWAFEQAGTILSAIGMVFVCFVANVGSDYILSAMARAEAVSSYLCRQGFETVMTGGNGEGKQRGGAPDETTALLLQRAEEAPSRPSSPGGDTAEMSDSTLEDNIKRAFDDVDDSLPIDLKKPMILTAKFFIDVGGGTNKSFAQCDDGEYTTDNGGRLIVGKRKYELTELSKLFLGRAGLRSYGVAVALDIYGFLWAYTSVFGAAMAHSFPVMGHGTDSYPLWVFVFALIVVPMSFLELSEQASVQVFLSGCRIVMILLMVLTPLAAAFWDSSGGDDIEPDHLRDPNPHFDAQIEPAGTPWFVPSKVHEMIPIIVFSVLFHQAVPSLADEITDKSTAGTVFGLTFVLCGCAYSLIGIVVAWYFGSGVYESSNINWESYHGGTGTLIRDETTGEEHWVGAAWWARMISFFVVCFPAIDVISAFPLNAFVLGNSLMGLVYVDDIQEVENNRRIATTYRAIAAIPPIFGALFVRDLGIITDYSGLTGLAIAFCFPALLYISSERKARELGVPFRTRYERMGSSIRSAWAMFILGIFTILYCFVLLAAKG